VLTTSLWNCKFYGRRAPVELIFSRLNFNRLAVLPSRCVIATRSFFS
jgi:hypothetical protein